MQSTTLVQKLYPKANVCGLLENQNIFFGRGETKPQVSIYEDKNSRQRLFT